MHHSYPGEVLSPVLERRPLATLGRILEDLGSTLLELVCGEVDTTSDVDSIVIHDPLDPAALPRNAIVLGVGVREPGYVVELLRELGGSRCVALVLRAPAPATDEIREAAKRAGVAVLSLTRGASWAQLAAMLRSLIARNDMDGASGKTLGGVPVGDLFALANAISALVDAPVTIEDRSSRVLAFSGRQDEADRARIDTILGRQVPEPSTRTLEEHGFFRELYRTDQPVFFEPSEYPISGLTVPRVALAIRAGDEILGSIWAAVRAPLSEERTQALREIGKVVALHLLSQRAGADAERRLRADLVDTLLRGGPDASQAASHLGLAHQPAIVLALTVRDHETPSPEDHAWRVAECQHLSDAFAMHLTASHGGAVTALLGDVAYGIVPVGGGRRNMQRRVAQLAADFVARVGSRTSAVIGIGSIATDSAALTRSRSEADRALRVLRTRHRDRRVASIDDVNVEALLMEVSDIIASRNERATGPVARLMDYDAKHRTHLVETLNAWLDAFGDVIAASQAVSVHPNTFRYRLRRLAQVGDIDLDDPDARFAAMVQLRLIVPPLRADDLALLRLHSVHPADSDVREAAH